MRMVELARSAHLRLIWQEPWHEALLLRQLEGWQTLPPSSSALDMFELHRRWPDHVNGTSAVQLARHIGIREIAWAASAEQSLREFLYEICFPIS